ncbi:4535_t:CDS:2 [Funneliformis geosporum]|uniref:7812_t:CDS:1 n=1 Tax=Funneliformis geosporum TaxID=1117311 RepID=A0A9W4SPP0_9GLOM|nr:4535_t:CDS:2 [Funneliformis geosporum]CAI2176724.1 7812_t:CDS:2 [Funneliformis geosporum]
MSTTLRTFQHEISDSSFTTMTHSASSTETIPQTFSPIMAHQLKAIGCILRGELILNLARDTNIRKLEMKFIGKTNTSWNDDKKTVSEEREIISHTWNFLEPSKKSKDINNNAINPSRFRLLALTTNAELGKVEYYLTAKASRSRLSSNIRLQQQVEILRTIPDHLNSQGIGFAREFNDMLSYEINIPKKAYPLGQKIPIEMKICPHVKKLKVTGVNVQLFEKTTYTSCGKKITDSRIAAFQSLNKFGENRLIEEEEEGDVGNIVYQELMNLNLPKCSQPVHYSCATPLISVAHDLKFSFQISLPQSNSPKRAELKISVPITILSCKAINDYIALPSYEDDSFYCPCHPEYLRMAKLILGENEGSRTYENSCHDGRHNLLNVQRNHYHRAPPSYEDSTAEH